MSAVQLLFTRRRHPGSALIRVATWSRWSHVALVDGDEVIEAAAPHGVRRASVGAAIDRAARCALVELPARDPAALLAAQAAGQRIQPDAAGRPIAVDPPPPPLDQVRAAAAAAIDAAAGAARARYITIAPGQEATYLIKAQQAREYRTAGYAGPVPALVQAEAAATGETAQVACDRILAEEAAWVAKAAEIESARRRGKVAVGAALDAAAVEAARDAAIAELAAL